MDKVYTTKIAYDQGYRVQKDGSVTLFNKPINKILLKKKNNNRNLLVFHINRNQLVYVSKLQAYQKFGEKALNENCFYVEGNTTNCSFDNIELKSTYKNSLELNNVYRCSKCGKELSEKHFYKTDLKNKAIKNRICICKNCLKEKRNNTHEYIQRFKDKCICCGESDVACLDFHHLNDKYESLSHMNSHSTDTINKEINKCVILCANCHRKLHYYKCNIDELKNKIHDRLQ